MVACSFLASEKENEPQAQSEDIVGQKNQSGLIDL